jgi:hypothetical protein
MTPETYFGVVAAEPAGERVVYVQQPSLADMTNPLDDQAFKYIIIIGIVIISIAALKYILKD